MERNNITAKKQPWLFRSSVVYCDVPESICIQVNYRLKFSYIFLDKNASLHKLRDAICDTFDINSKYLEVCWAMLNHHKPLRWHGQLTLSDYGMRDGDTILIMETLPGGASGSPKKEVFLPVSDSTYVANNMIRGSTKEVLIHGLKVQSSDEGVPRQAFIHDILDAIADGGNLLDSWDPRIKRTLDVLESFVLCMGNLRLCQTDRDVYRQFDLFFKLMYGFDRHLKAIKWGARALKKFTGGEIQSLDYTETVKALRMTFEGASKVVSNPLVNKFRRLYAYMLTQGLLRCVGMELSEEDFSRLEIKNYRATYSSRVDLCWCVLDTVITVLERIDDYKQTGTVTAFLHGRDSHADWLKKTDELLALQQFTCNLEAHGTTQFAYFAEINDQIEIGEAIVKHTKASTGVTNMFVRSKLHALQLLKASEITRRASQKERPAPLGVLVHGRSSVGKSSFTKMLYYYYGKIFNLPIGEEYRYVRTATDEYWSGFDTSKWCIQLDDVAFLDPAKAQEDPSIYDALNLINNVPFNPPQAAIEDKGRTPVRSELVIATTNQKDLNAPHYFSCPLAVRRRFPFVVKVEPKPKYCHDNGVFLDPEKLEPCEGFPDYWIITVQKLVPRLGAHDRGGKDYASLEDVAVYSDVEDFLRDFAETARMHKLNQARALSSDQYMAELKVCPKCFLSTKCSCLNVQALECLAPVTDWVKTKTQVWYRRYLLWFGEIITWIIVHRYVIWFMTVTGHYRAFRFLWMKLLVPWLPGHEQMSLLGAWWKQNGNKFLIGITFIMGISAALYLSHMSSALMVPLKKSTKSKTDDELDNKEDPVVDMGVQGNAHSLPEDRFEKEAAQNVWYNPTVELVPFDIPLASRSLAGKSNEEIQKLLVNNCVRLEIKYKLEGVSMTKKICGVFVKTHYLLINNHAFPRDNESYEVTIFTGKKTIGVCSNLKFTLWNSDIVRNPEKELAMVCVRSLPPFKDITRFWHSGEPLPISKGLFVRRDELGEPVMGVFRKAEVSKNVFIQDIGYNLDVYFTQQTIASQNGDCGSLIVNMTPRGPMICALHLLGRDKNVGYQVVNIENINDLIRQIENNVGSMPVCSSGEPLLNNATSNFSIQPLHAKSNVRYHTEGSANVRGGLSGFRPTPRSNVTLTPKVKEVCDHFEYKIQHGAPIMNGWLPWSNNFVEMINPTINHNRTLLHTVGKSFLSNIVESLQPGWQERLCVLSPEATVNGLKGVKFIDGVNRNSSMGHPWNKSKRNFLVEAPTEKHPDGVTFPVEVWDRVAKIEECYDNGSRAYPVFTASLKDEAVAFSKIKIAKTRAFAGAPVDWSLVVRKYFLTFVKLLQENKFVFEAAPGTNCMSSEWTDIHQFLTFFGDHKIVAGDYSKFDKKMISDFILEAFWIIIEMHRMAGASEETIQRMWGVATDTAFSLVNFNGDLIEFFGTNPSGHPLTVIINSIVNCLYMRYAYYKLNPESECDSFQKNVHLMTYGDDNIMGVSDVVPWFNHTAIQQQMEAIGVKYTMADKESESVPYINISECEFLKRKWRWEPEIGMYACPLNEESIMKSLTVWTASKSICKEEQYVNVVVSANMEYFWHGREKFQFAHTFFASLLRDPDYQVYLPKGGLLTWDQLVEKHSIL